MALQIRRTAREGLLAVGSPILRLDGKFVVRKLLEAGADADLLSVQLVDTQTEMVVVDARITYQDFIKTILDARESDCTYRILPAQLLRLGMVRETKRIEFPIPSYDTTSAVIKAQLSVFEVDGWRVVDQGDVWTHANTTPDKAHRYVLMERYNHPPDEDDTSGDTLALPPLVTDDAIDYDALSGVVK